MNIKDRQHHLLFYNFKNLIHIKNYIRLDIDTKKKITTILIIIVIVAINNNNHNFLKNKLIPLWLFLLHYSFIIF